MHPSLKVVKWYLFYGPQEGKTQSEASIVKDGTEQADKGPSALLVPSGGRATSHSAEDFSSCKKMLMSRFFVVCVSVVMLIWY